jgi:formiminotetrahydrofolate cyclodeaminase
MKLHDLTIKQFIEKTASNEAMPAGGSTLALCAALAAALAEMVIKLTFGKAKYAKAYERMRVNAIELERLRILLMRDIDRDAESYQIVLDAYQLPKGSDDEIDMRKNEIENALKAATLVQMEVAEKCHNLFGLITDITNIVGGSLFADSRVSLMICSTAAKGAVFNVITNLSQIHDSDFKNEVIAKCNKIDKDIDIKL